MKNGRMRVLALGLAAAGVIGSGAAVVATTGEEAPVRSEEVADHEEESGGAGSVKPDKDNEGADEDEKSGDSSDKNDDDSSDANDTDGPGDDEDD